MLTPIPALICATLLVQVLSLAVALTTYRLRILDLALKRMTTERDAACLDLCEIIAELGRLRAFRSDVSKQLRELSEDLANAQRAIVKVHGPHIITPERRAIITAASKVDQVRTSKEGDLWASST